MRLCGEGCRALPSHRRERTSLTCPHGLCWQPLGIHVTIDGAAVEQIELELPHGDDARIAEMRLVPVPITSTHAIITLTMYGERARQRVSLDCAASCSFVPVPFKGRAVGMHRIRLGSGSQGARLRLVVH